MWINLQIENAIQQLKHLFDQYQLNTARCLSPLNNELFNGLGYLINFPLSRKSTLNKCRLSFVKLDILKQ